MVQEGSKVGASFSQVDGGRERRSEKGREGRKRIS